MKAWRADRRVNNVTNNEPALWEPLTEDDSPKWLEPPKTSKPKLKKDESGQLGMFG
jgi:hypothetical protein